jgi:hypothetical protein
MTNTKHAKAGDTIYIVDSNGGDEFIDRKEHYYVVEVLEEDDENSKCFRLLDVDLSWWARPEHYEIVELGKGEEEHLHLLKEAARRYPRGTHYLEVGSGVFGTVYSSLGSPPKIFDQFKGSPRIMIEEGRGLVYMKGVWAPIVHPSYQRFQTDDTVVRWRDVEDWEWNGIGDINLPPIGEPYQIERFHESRDLSKLPSIDLGIGWYPATAFVFQEYYNQSITNRGTAEHLNDTEHVKSKISTGISIEVQRPLASIITGKGRAGSRVQGRGNAAIVGGGYSRHKAITGK